MFKYNIGGSGLKCPQCQKLCEISNFMGMHLGIIKGLGISASHHHTLLTPMYVI